MSPRKEAARTYFAGFGQSDHGTILALLIEEGDTVVVPHHGEVRRKDGSLLAFAAVDVLAFDGDLICRVESYVVPLST